MKNERFRVMDLESSLLGGAIYDSELNELRITFKTGQAYLYEEFKEGDWKELQDSESKGSHFNKVIKPNFKCSKLQEDEI